MRLRAYLLLAAGLGAAAFLVTAAMAGDLPNEGTFSAAYKTEGSFRGEFQEKSAVNPAPHIIVWDETGKVIGDGILKDMAWRCFGTNEIINGIAESSDAYCVGAGQDGQIVFRMATDKRDWTYSRLINASGVSIGGTGKYSGITANYKVRCQFRITGMNHGGYAKDCDGEGSYKLP